MNSLAQPQAHAKHASVSGRLDQLEPAAVDLGDASRRGQPQPRPLSTPLGREEGPKDLIADLGEIPRPVSLTSTWA